MLGNVAHPRISMKQEGICSSNGKDGPGRAMQREIYDDWNIRVGKQVEGRNSWMAYIDFLACVGAWQAGLRFTNYDD